MNLGWLQSLYSQSWIGPMTTSDCPNIQRYYSCPNHIQANKTSNSPFLNPFIYFMICLSPFFKYIWSFSLKSSQCLVFLETFHSYLCERGERLLRTVQITFGQVLNISSLTSSTKTDSDLKKKKNSGVET